jgi:hypothetical protein
MRTATKREKLFITIAVMWFAACGLLACRPHAEPLGLFAPSRLAHVLGQDGVAPISFDERLVLWSFGDTILGEWKGGVSALATFSERAIVKAMPSNSLGFSGPLSKDSIQDPGFEYYRENGKVVPFIRTVRGEDPARTRLWALDGIRIRNSVYVYYVKIRIDEPGKPLAITPQGTGLARWDVPPGWHKGMPMQFIRMDGLFSGSEPVFGGCVIEKDGFCYLTGQQTKKDFKSYAFIARVPKEHIAKRSEYRFWSRDTAWDADIAKATPLFGDLAGECTISYNEARKSFIIVYCRLGKGEIALTEFRDFADLDSSSGMTVYRMPKLQTKEEGHFYYSAKEVYSSGNDLYVIYIDPVEYQPYLVRIAL